MTDHRIRHAALLLALSAAIVLPSAAALASNVPGVPPVPSRRAAVDPVGQYQWSLTMAAMQNTQVTGTVTITRKDSTLSGTLTSDHTNGDMPAKSVTQDGNKVTVVTEGDFGQFTLVIDFSEAEPTGTFKFVGQDGTADQGPASIKRLDKK